MVRELIIGLYLIFFKLQFNFFKLFPLQDKVTFVVSFKQNNLYIYEELKRRDVASKIVFLSKNPQSIKGQVDNATVLAFETKDIISFIRSIYHLATSRTVFVDNYYGFLSAVLFKDDVECIQLWHAAGAIKAFGLKDQSNASRSARAQMRFKKVYNNFHKVVVGSDAFANILMEAFDLSEDRILRTGMPRTDFFYDFEAHKSIRANLYRTNPSLKNKKVILYAPTYRDGQLNHFDMKLDLELLQKQLKDEYVVIVKLHPAIRADNDFDRQYPNFVYDYSDYSDINHLLLITDLLITDYSSIPYEFSILGKPMIFFSYDLEQYKTDRGIWKDYEEMLPGPVVYNTEDIIACINDDHFDLKKIRDFARTWNRYSTGKSSRNLVSYLYKQEEQFKVSHG
ncbi:CDP-glycerol glycerophosphotransferase family protein [Bacillus suaedaesalsae]|uniref:CDP-glycerol glycerophosphotransferase family protein n=1 Tax=Bacillus suaedaesalsae TaxID=2810349 RepID=A0ABS2DKR5_9BACI|nr:CDP-glycerol glycerophosphotransferase family protein [Bacillus suaedaesalsae]MBM6619084.1 CDP-glycerol glycerophosphotransferase family protein [Bacillus suaedaesalsae]